MSGHGLGGAEGGDAGAGVQRQDVLGGALPDPQVEVLWSRARRTGADFLVQVLWRG